MSLWRTWWLSVRCRYKIPAFQNVHIHFKIIAWHSFRLLTHAIILLKALNKQPATGYLSGHTDMLQHRIIFYILQPPVPLLFHCFINISLWQFSWDAAFKHTGPPGSCSILSNYAPSLPSSLGTGCLNPNKYAKIPASQQFLNIYNFSCKHELFTQPLKVWPHVKTQLLWSL